jgi:hypothetical protein
MPKTKISEYSTTNTDNSDIEGINIAEGCAPSGINNAIRELMVHLKEFQTGASGDAFTFAGGTLMSGTNTISGAAIISGNINSSGSANTFSGGVVHSGTNTFSSSVIISGNISRCQCYSVRSRKHPRCRSCCWPCWWYVLLRGNADTHNPVCQSHTNPAQRNRHSSGSGNCSVVYSNTNIQRTYRYCLHNYRWRGI